MTASENGLRSCGLYRTTTDLVEHPDTVGPGRLVYYHNHSDQGPPMVMLPHNNAHNKWRFHSKGHSIRDTNYIASLEALKHEGMYRLREHFHPDEGRIVAANALVQLGYNAKGEPILFFPTRHDTDNALLFPSKGMGIPAKVYELLEPLDVRGPQSPKQLH